MCKNLVEKGNLDKPLILYNRTQKRADDLSAKLGSGKTKVVSQVRDAVKDSDIVFICLGDDDAVNATVDVILQENVKGKLIVDCSTVHPDTTNALEKRITEAGAEFVGGPGTCSISVCTFSLHQVPIFNASVYLIVSESKNQTCSNHVRHILMIHLY